MHRAEYLKEQKAQAGDEMENVTKFLAKSQNRRPFITKHSVLDWY